MGEHGPLVDVIVAVYNVEPYLKRCVDSLLGQDFSDFVITLVDDGSTDGSGAICDTYAASLPDRVRVIHQENTGQATARNRAVARSDAAFIAFVDADDRVSPNYLSALYGAAERAGAGMAAARICTETPRPDGTVSQQFYRVPEPLVMERDQALEAVCLEADSGVSGFLCGKLTRRENMLAHPFPQGRLFEDSYAVWRQVADCGRLACVPEAVYYYWLRVDSTQHKRFEPRHMDLIDAVKDMMDAFRSEGAPPAVLAAGSHKVCRACYVTAYHAADLPYGPFRGICADLVPLMREHWSAACSTGRLDIKTKLLCRLLMMSPPLFFAAVRLTRR